MPKKKILKFNNYVVRVSDPDVPGSEVTYPHVRAVSPAHADREGRDGFCGLLGVDPEVYKRLVVEVQQIPQG